MILTLPRILETEIRSFCYLNKIEDINNFLVCCLRDGFNIMKYGMSPQDNFNKENKPLKIEDYVDKKESDSERVEGEEKKKRGRPRKDSIKEEESLSGQEVKAEELKPKKKIRIIKN